MSLARRDRESAYDSDTHDLLFGAAGDDDHPSDGYPSDGHRGDPQDPATHAPIRRSRSETRHATRRDARNRHRRRIVAISAVAVVAIVLAAGYFIALPIYHYLSPEDYSGTGTGSVVVTVEANSGSSQIGDALEHAGVVASARAFTDAAEDDDRAQNIQPGSYRLHRHMSASSALTLLLDPSSRVATDTVVPEGANVFSVSKSLMLPACNSAKVPAGGCGLGATSAQLAKALRNVGNLGIPTDYLPAGKQPTTIEGFLYPATYSFDAGTTVTEALQQMVGKFTDVARADGLSAKAKALGITPYQAVVIASMAQAEAKFAGDMPKVVRVILNRLARKEPLKIDATSVYAAELKGVDPKSVDYATIDSPYNTYRNSALPPTPISNPGSDALDAAVAPAAGKDIFYVNGDAAGHLFFTDNEADFIKAQKRCADNGWGCAQP